MRKKNLMSFVLSIIVAFSSLFSFVTPTAVLAATPTPTSLGEVTVRSIQPGQSLMKNNKGILYPHTVDFVMYSKDGKDWPAYCIEPSKPGAQTGSSYVVNGANLLENPKVYGAIMNGFPFKSAADLGVSSDYKAFYATKMAIWTVLGTPNFAFDDMEANGADNNDVYEAYKKIYAAAEKTNSMDSTTLTAVASGSGKDDVAQTKYYTFSVTPATSGYIVTLDGTQPIGTKITDMDGNPATTFAAGAQFKVVIPKSSITQNGSFKFSLAAGSGAGKALVYQGVPKTNPTGTQDYALVYEEKLDGNGTVNYTTDTTTTGFGKLKVYKKEAGT